MEQSLIVPDEVRAALSVAGWDMDSEMENMSTEHSGFEIPVIRVEHRTNSKHVFYLDRGPSYNVEDQSEVDLGDTLAGVIFAHQHIRAKWVEGKRFQNAPLLRVYQLEMNPLLNCANTVSIALWAQVVNLRSD